MIRSINLSWTLDIFPKFTCQVAAMAGPQERVMVFFYHVHSGEERDIKLRADEFPSFSDSF
jgi:hypothetical protein